MYVHCVLALFLASAVSFTNTEYLSCPFAALSQAYDTVHNQPPILRSSSSAYSTLEQSNPIYNNIHNENNLNLPVSSFLQRFLMSEAHNNQDSELRSLAANRILKSILDEPIENKLKCAIPPETCANDTNHYYYRSVDGSCNNLENPGFGMAFGRYGRLLPPKYGGSKGYAPSLSRSGVPLPNSRLLSLALYGEHSELDQQLTLAYMQWGQIVAHDISRLTTRLNGITPEDCCSNIENKMCYPIALHPNGPIKTRSDKSCLGFARAVSDVNIGCNHHPNYAEKISTVTSYLDLSSIYGNSQKEYNKVRHFSGGLLKTSFANNRQWLPVSMNIDGECGEDNYKCYSIPDRRNQFIPSITVMQTILLREHNRIACSIAQLNPHYSDEKLYQEARKINIAQYQKIIYYDWLPHLVGPSFAYANSLIHYVHGGDYVNDYNPTIDPAPIAESATAALRYCHTQIPGYFSLVTPNRRYNVTKRLSDYFEKPSNMDFLIDGDNFDSVIRGMITQPQKKSDANIDVELKHHFNRKLNNEYGADLKSFDIQRGRDYGLPPYNDLRAYCGLPRAETWMDLINEIPIEKIEILQKIYATPDDIDLAVGGSLENHAPEAILGPTFRCIVGKQFVASRIGDRFFYENENLFSGFSKEQLTEIRKVSLSSLLCNNADYLQFTQPNAFMMPSEENAIISCNLIPQLNLGKWKTVQQEAIH